MAPSLRALLVGALVLLSACAAPGARQAERAAPPAPLVLISIDGFRADFYDRGVTPNLARLGSEGVHALGMRPSFPSLTFPNHYTLVTGLYPDHHGIVHNIMRDPVSNALYKYNDPGTTADPAWWGGEPIWVTAEKHGIRSATMFWPGTDVAIGGVRPSHWMKYDGRVTPERRVDAVLHWFDLPERERPRFFTLYFDQVDHAGHDFGPDSPEVNAAAATVDAAIGRLMAGLAHRGLAEKVNVVIVSDHGQAGTSMDRLIYMDDLLGQADANMTLGAVVGTLGIVAGFKPPPEYAARLEQLLLGRHDHFQCWRKEDIPARFHYGTNPRVPPLVCLVDMGWVFATHDWVAQKKGHLSLGEHGYDIDAPEMRAFFLAHGPSFRPGVEVPPFDNVDVYPLLARLLGVPAAPNDGDATVMTPMLKAPPP